LTITGAAHAVGDQLGRLGALGRLVAELAQHGYLAGLDDQLGEVGVGRVDVVALGHESRRWVGLDVGDADGRLIAFDFAGYGRDLKDQGIGDHLGRREGGVRMQGLGVGRGGAGHGGMARF
jgi:hypothetical protein